MSIEKPHLMAILSVMKGVHEQYEASEGAESQLAWEHLGAMNRVEREIREAENARRRSIMKATPEILKTVAASPVEPGDIDNPKPTRFELLELDPLPVKETK